MKLFDLHCDTATECEKQGVSLVSNSLDWDFLRASKLFSSSVQATAVYIPDDMNEEDAWSYALRVFSFIDGQSVPIFKCDEDFYEKPHGIVLAVENGKAIGDDLSRIAVLASMGVKYITVTWNGSNRLGHGALSGKTEGLTVFGKAAVAEMLRYGIYPDVSHLNEAGFWDVAKLSQGLPMLASHSDSMAVHAHPRNLTDDQFRAVRDSGGLVGLNLCKEHLGCHSFEQFERHFVKYLELDGENTVALGMDLDGTPVPKTWHGVEVAVRLYDRLLSKGYAQALVDALFYENSLAFFTKSLTSREKCIRIGT